MPSMNTYPGTQNPQLIQICQFIWTTQLPPSKVKDMGSHKTELPHSHRVQTPESMKIVR